ncbi:MAG TPA: phosphatidate cytidylyltransferase [Thermotogota bacterium]|nr:phosphatidate cytidylyltransferase [Thermotogota bacterium]
MKKDRFNQKSRWISGILVGTAVVLCFFHWVSFLALAISVAFLAGFEYVRMVLPQKAGRWEAGILIALYPLMTFWGALLLGDPQAASPQWEWILVGFGVLIPLVGSVGLWLYKDPAVVKENLIDILFGLFYISFTLFLGVIVYWRYSWAHALMVVTCPWIFDTGAFYFGIKFGKRKLMPSISPKKTVEGFLGGTLVSLVGVWLYAQGLSLLTPEPVLRLGESISISLVLALSATFGDLFESALKRYHSRKDMGGILPGHGGFLDRMDSMLFFIPMFLLVMMLFR